MLILIFLLLPVAQAHWHRHVRFRNILVLTHKEASFRRTLHNSVPKFRTKVQVQSRCTLWRNECLNNSPSTCVRYREYFASSPNVVLPMVSSSNLKSAQAHGTAHTAGTGWRPLKTDLWSARKSFTGRIFPSSTSLWENWKQFYGHISTANVFCSSQTSTNLLKPHTHAHTIASAHLAWKNSRPIFIITSTRE